MEPQRTLGCRWPARRSGVLLILKRRSGSGAPTSPARAVAAGLAERTVRIAERQGQLMGFGRLMPRNATVSCQLRRIDVDQIFCDGGRQGMQRKRYQGAGR